MKRTSVPCILLGTLLVWSVGCGGESAPVASTPAPAQPAATAPQTQSQPQPPQPASPAPQSASQTPSSLASADGELPGLRVEIQELKRTEGGTVTLKLAVINTGGRTIYNVSSFNAINLIDAVGKKKYFVAEDSAGACLCSRPLGSLEAGGRANAWAKFPAPPEDVQKIAVVIPKFLPLEGVPISR
jgi:hypothetical protein